MLLGNLSAFDIHASAIELWATVHSYANSAILS